MPLGSTDSWGSWPDVLVASLLGVGTSLAVLGGSLFALVALAPPDSALLLILFLVPTVGGTVAGALSPRDSSASVGSGLLVGLSLGVIMLALGIGQFFDLLGGDQAEDWILGGIFGTPFLMLLTGAGGVVGGGVSAFRAGPSDRPTTEPDEGDPPAALEGAADGETVGWRSSLVGMVRAILEGTGATVVLGVVGLFAGPMVLVVPFLGGFVAGSRSPGGVGNGTFCGLVAGVLGAVLALALIALGFRIVYLGTAAGFVLLFLLVMLLLAIPIAAIGGFAGAMAAASDESSDDSEAPAHSAES